MIEYIISKSNKRIKHVVSLKESKYRKEFNEFVGESLKSLQMADKANLVKEIYTLKKLDDYQHINQYIVDEQIMKKISSSKSPEGVVFVVKIPTFNKKTYAKVLYLDHIQDPGNLGTMIRTALAFNFDAVILSKGSVSIYNEKTLAACKGANYLIPVFEDDISNYKNDHIIITSALSNSAIDLDNLNKIEDKFILVIGNEAHGVNDEIIAISNHVVKIPISNIDSLNASIAAGILMYKLTK